ncbi:MAG: hypothetical protein RL518_2441, partial [Pseudomonadota bacterium]
VDHAESADRSGLEDDVTLKDGAGGEYADIHRVSVTYDLLSAGRLGAELADPVTAQSTRNESIQGGAVV